MKKIVKYSVFGLIALLSACSNDSTKKETSKKEETIFSTSQVVLLQPQKEIVLPGDLKPYFITSIFPKIKGFVKSVQVDRGSQVRKGQLLATIEAPELEAQLAEANAKVNQTLSNLSASIAYYQRVLQTSKTVGAISFQEMDSAHAKAQADSANVAAARANLALIKQMQQYLIITAPFDGTITERNVSVGELVGPDEAAKIKPLFIIEDTQKLRLTVAIPEIYVGSLMPHQTVTFKVAAIPEKIFSANLSRTAESLADNIRSMITEFDFINTNHVIKSGMYADVHLPVQRKAPTTFVPTKAVVNSTEKLFVIKTDGTTAQWVDIQKGISLDSLTEVFGNIGVNDKVISPASDEIKDGQKIKIK